jgi:predicted Zn-dependent peptidase
MKKWIIILVTGLSLSLGIAAKETPPTGATPKDFKLTQTDSVILDNGLKITFVPYGKTPKVTLRLITKTGSYDDNGKDGIADVSYELLTEGTANRTALEIAQQAADMGGEVTTLSGSNTSYIQMDVLSEFVVDAAELMADIAINTKLNQDDLDRVKTNMARTLQVQKSQAQGIATEALFQTIYDGHPYASVFADEETLATITVEDVKNHLTTNLVAKRSELFISGKFDIDNAKAMVGKAFSSMAQGAPRDVLAPDHKGKGSFVFIPRENAPQSTIRLGLPIVGPDHKDYIGLQLMNNLLGGSFSSRITANIREDKGYTYSPNSAVSTRVNSSLWFQSADVTAESTAASFVEIIKEIKRLQVEPPTTEELEGFKNYVAGIYVLQNSSRTAIINQLWFLESHGLPLSRLETYVQKVNAITPAEISRLTKEYLNVESMTMVVVGDEASVMPQLNGEAMLESWLKQ